MGGVDRRDLQRLLQRSIIELCRTSLPLGQTTEVDAILCISLSEADQIVVKVHETLSASSADYDPPIATSSSSVARPPPTSGELAARLRQQAAASFYSNIFFGGVGRELGERTAPTSTSHKRKATTSQSSDAGEAFRAMLNSSSSGGRNQRLLPSNGDAKRSRPNPGVDSVIRSLPMGAPSGGLWGNQMQPIGQTQLPEAAVAHNSSQSSPSGQSQPLNLVKTVTSSPSSSSLQCSYCDAKLVSENALKEHIKLAHNKYECKSCSRTFLYQENYILHLKRECSNGELEKNSVVVIPEAIDEQQAKGGNSEKTPSCGVCHQKFEDGNLVLQHLKTAHIFNKCFSCFLCQEFYPDRALFVSHRRSVHSGRKMRGAFKCLNCEVRFATQGEFEYHQLECGYSPSASDDVTNGFDMTNLTPKKEVVDENDNNDLVIKSLPLESTPVKTSRNSHILAPPRLTATCGDDVRLMERNYRSRAETNDETIHDYSSSPEGAGGSSIGTVTSQLDSLEDLYRQAAYSPTSGDSVNPILGRPSQYHKVISTGRPRIQENLTARLARGPFRCVNCDDLFHEFSAFEEHNVQRHQRYVCPFCGNTFASRRNVKRHMRKHTGETPYSCTLCPQRFFRDDDLRRHMKVEHGMENPSVKTEDGLREDEEREPGEISRELTSSERLFHDDSHVSSHAELAALIPDDEDCTMPR